MQNAMLVRLAVGPFALATCLVTSQPSEAVPIQWTDWTTVAGNTVSGSAGSVNVLYTGGPLLPSPQTAGGTNFWATNSVIFTDLPNADNPPPDADIIRLTGGSTDLNHSIVFSQPVTNPVMAIMSLGQPNFLVQYDFNAPFDVLNFGPGHFGLPGTLTELAGNILQGDEGHGLIQFQGNFTGISWQVPIAEFWHGFQVGIPVPEPGLAGLMALGLLTLAVRKRRRHNPRR